MLYLSCDFNNLYNSFIFIHFNWSFPLDLDTFILSDEENAFSFLNILF